MLDPRVLDNHELEAELAALRRGRDAAMDEGASDTSSGDTDALIRRFEEEIRSRHDVGDNGGDNVITDLP